MDEFESIARLFRPLAVSPEALGLRDDAALLPSRPGCELVVTADAIVEGVHFLPDDPPDLIARKLLRVNLSDLAAKGAEPYGYLLTVAWSSAWDEGRRTDFARGLGEDQAHYGLKLFGGDTVSTPGPMTASVTMLGFVEQGRMVRRSGARAGDVLLVSGTIGDGVLGLKAARGALEAPPDDLAWLADRYRLPRPRLECREALLRYATAAADVSDGLLADAGHIGAASGVRVEVELDRLPVSPAASVLALRGPLRGRLRMTTEGTATGNPHPEVRGGTPSLEGRGLLDLATGGDDYEIVCAAEPHNAPALVEAGFTVIGRMTDGEGISVTFGGRPMAVERTGWRHG